MNVYSPITVASNCVKFRVIELEHISAITHWVIANQQTGADLIIGFPVNTIWVIVPEVLLHSFLELYGSSVIGV